MKGLIFNLLEEFLSERYGEEAYEDMVAACGPLATDPHSMVAPGSYSDQDFTNLVDCAAGKLGLSAVALLHDFGRAAIGSIARRYPHFFAKHRHPRDFLNAMDFIHMLEVKKLYTDADPPRFSYEALDGGGLKIVYHSSRRLCPFFSGLIDGTGDYYRIAITQRHESCMTQGHEECTFVLAFADQQGAADVDG